MLFNRRNYEESFFPGKFTKCAGKLSDQVGNKSTNTKELLYEAKIPVARRNICLVPVKVLILKFIPREYIRTTTKGARAANNNRRRVARTKIQPPARDIKTSRLIYDSNTEIMGGARESEIKMTDLNYHPLFFPLYHLSLILFIYLYLSCSSTREKTTKLPLEKEK